MFVNIKTEHNFLKSLCKIDELIDFANKNNIHELGIVDDFFLMNSSEFILKCNENKIKPIVGVNKKVHGIEFDIYALNKEGIYSLNSMPSLVEDLNYLVDKNLHIVFNVIKYKKEFGDDIPFLNYSFSYDEKIILDENLANDHFSKMIFNEQIRFLYKDEVEYYTILQSVNNKRKYLQEKRNHSKYIHLSFEEKMSKIKTLSKPVLENTQNFINKFTGYNYDYKFEQVLDFESYKNLDFRAELLKNLDTYLENNKTLKKEIYVKRLNHEVDVIEKLNFSNYFYIMQDIITYLNENNIKYGYGRGSAAGSLVSFLLKITKIDPIKYNLFFERFLNEKRSSLPDIDLDVSDVHRQKIISYLIDKYGESNVAKIFTTNHYLAKSAFNDLAKSLEFDKKLIKKISSKLVSGKTFEENFNENYKFFGKYETDIKFDFLRESMKRIEGLSRNVSIHAAGIIISNINIKNVGYVQDNVIYSSATSLEKLGFVKFDLLGLTNLSFLANLESKVYEIDSNYSGDNISLNYEPAFKILGDAKTFGIFQLESEGIKNVLKKYKPHSILDIAIVISMYRPGPMKNIDLLIKNKDNPQGIQYIHENLKPILQQTYGIIVFQEQIMDIVKVVANFTNSEADIFRVAMSKKKLKEMEELKEKFIANGIENGYSKTVLVKLYENILMFAGYGFNKAHAVSYARLIYQITYIKAKYPTIYYNELFKHNINSSSREDFLLELDSLGVKILPPDVLDITMENKLERGTIIIGLAQVKGIRIDKLEQICKLAHEVDDFGLTNFLKNVVIPVDLDDDEKLQLVGSGIFNKYETNLKSIYNTLLKYSKIDLNIINLTGENIKIQKSEDFTFKEKSEIEKKSLGFNILYSKDEYLIKKLNKKYKNAIIHKNVNVHMSVGVSYFFLGQLVELKEIINKNNEPMAFLKLKLKFYELEITVFTEIYLKLKEKLAENLNLDIIVKVGKSKRGNFVLEDVIL